MILGELAAFLAYDSAAERLVLPADDGGIDARDLDSGWLRWHADVADRALVAAHGRVLVVKDRTVRVLDLDTGAPRCEVGVLDAPAAVAEGAYAWIGDVRIDLDTCALAAVPYVTPPHPLTTIPAGADGRIWAGGRWASVTVEATGCTWFGSSPAAQRGLGACDYAVYHGRDHALLGVGNERRVVRMADGSVVGTLPADSAPDLRWAVIGGRYVRIRPVDGAPRVEVWDLDRGKRLWTAPYLAEQ